MPSAVSSSADATIALDIKELHKSFGNLHVLKGVDLQTKRGDVVAIIGGSGSGKSTLLRCINLLENPSDGGIAIGGEKIHLKRVGSDLQAADKKQLQRLRSRLGMVLLALIYLVLAGLLALVFRHLENRLPVR